jgi:hypothetical protein
MTEKKAKKISVKLWRDIVGNELNNKRDSKFFDKYEIYRMLHGCPLCELYYKDPGCGDCPISKVGQCCRYASNWFEIYIGFGNNEKRMAAAKNILNCIKAWKI